MDPVYNQKLYLPLATAAAGEEGVGDIVDGNVDNARNDFLADQRDGETLNAMSRRQFTDAEFADKVAGLNESQQAAYQAIVEFTRSLHGYHMGTVEHGRRTDYRKLSSEKLHDMRRDWRNVDTVVIDEISMVSYQTLYFVHRRLTEIKGTNDVVNLFGGLNVVTVGDFFQLPPVRDKFVFEDGTGYNPGSTHLWRDQFRLVELTTNMRQRGDTAYSQLLNQVRIGQHTRGDLSVLRTRLTSGVSDPIQLDRAPFVDALRLFPRRDQVEQHNESCLRALSRTSTVYKFARHCGIAATGHRRGFTHNCF